MPGQRGRGAGTIPIRFPTTLIILLVWQCAVVASQLLSTGLTITLNHIPYYISPHTAANLSLTVGIQPNITDALGFIPVTVLPREVSFVKLPNLFKDWAIADDVFQVSFTETILFDAQRGNVSNTSSSNLTPGFSSTLVGYSTPSEIPNGPYFLHRSTGSLHRVYRLYDDFSGSFNEALLHKPDNTFQVLSAKVPGSATLTIGVPSRLYYEPSRSQPLAGMRIAVKDIFELAGVRRSNGNRAWYHFYPPSNFTGTAISRLIKAGAVVVGTQRASQFATGEVATVDWVDYHSPFNPRGDGYQDPSSSSSGAAASIASYEWLDAAVGTDTGGSIRSPAGVNGVFGNRASHGLVSLDHAMPLSEPLDTAGFLVRDPSKWDKLQAVLYGDNYNSVVGTASYPSQIMTIEFPNSSTEAGRLANDFASALAGFLGAQINSLDVEERWAAKNNSSSLAVMLNTTYPVLTGQGQTEKVVTPFYKEYAALYDGRTPFVNPAPLARWAWAAPYSWDDAIYNKTLFRDWFNSEILPECSSGIILYPSQTGGSTPRNRYGIAPPMPFLGYRTSRISVFSGCPDFSFPVGEVSIFSNLTNHIEKFPVAVGVIAARGCDGLLTSLAIDLVKIGILNVPKIGRTLSGELILK